MYFGQYKLCRILTILFSCVKIIIEYLSLVKTAIFIRYTLHSIQYTWNLNHILPTQCVEFLPYSSNQYREQKKCGV
jgi:hypothetical protein